MQFCISCKTINRLIINTRGLGWYKVIDTNTTQKNNIKFESCPKDIMWNPVRSTTGSMNYQTRKMFTNKFDSSRSSSNINCEQIFMWTELHETTRLYYYNNVCTCNNINQSLTVNGNLLTQRIQCYFNETSSWAYCGWLVIQYENVELKCLKILCGYGPRETCVSFIVHLVGS